MPKSASFFPYYVHKALTDKTVYKVEARLTLQIPRSFSSAGDIVRRRLRNIRFRGPGVQSIGLGSPGFRLTGFWSESTGKLCMVGSGLAYAHTGNSRSLNVILKVNYSKNSSIYGSLVSGVLESLDDNGHLDHFEPVSILGIAHSNENYEYKLIEKGNRDWCMNEGGSLPMNEVDGGLCSVLTERNHIFKLYYENNCDNVNCNPLNGSVEYVPSFMSLLPIRCAEQRKMQMLMSFRNSSNQVSTFLFNPSTTLVAEGAWDEKTNSFCAVACRILNFTDSLSDAVVGDCNTKLSLRFPAFLSITRMSAIVGQVWSDRTQNDQGYFGRIGFWSLRESLMRFPGLRYEYTQNDRVRKACANKSNTKRKGKAYADGHSPDMRFRMSLKNSKGVTVMGYAQPIFVGDQLYGNQLAVFKGAKQPGVAIQRNYNNSGLMNISYKMRLPSDLRFGGDAHTTGGVEISAEGTYDRDTGVLCMIGCWPLGSNSEKSWKNHSMDCDIVINAEFSPLDSQSSDRVSGTIGSTREKSDPLYFERIDFWSNSISSRQAKESIWRMDLEITMVLISNTFACLFVGLQLYHMKKHPDMLPFVSIVMLIVLTLGHMIPLLLNFEAFFSTNHNQQYMFVENGGWLEANEIIVRMVTMVAFLLEFRLLQLSWTARLDSESQSELWVSDRKVLYMSLPLYIAGGLIAWLVNFVKNSQRSPFIGAHHRGFIRPYQRHVRQQHSLWGDLKSYGGLILDGFLLPQVLFNAVFNSRERPLAASFYLGTTIVRLLPHAYDLYRAHSSSWYLDWSYIYANHKMDFYSTAWDIIIPCGGMLFAILIFLQQRFGGWSILPRKLRENYVYEKVPTVSNVELQGESAQKNFDSL